MSIFHRESDQLCLIDPSNPVTLAKDAADDAAIDGIDALLLEIQQIAQAVTVGLGSGHTETTYRNAVEIEAEGRGWSVQREVVLPITYKNTYVGQVRCDIILTRGDTTTILELKALRKLSPEAERQLTIYLQLTGISCGFLINFALRGDTQVSCVRVCPKDILEQTSEQKSTKDHSRTDPLSRVYTNNFSNLSR